MKKLTFKWVLLNLLLAMPIFAFAAISEQDRVNDKAGSHAQETYANILNSCTMSGTDTDSCLSKFKAQSSEQKPAHNQVNSGKYCCENVSGGWGEYAYIHGQDYCIPPC